MTKVGINSLIVTAGALFIALVVGIILVFGQARPIPPELLDVDFVDELLGNSNIKGAEPVNGESIDIQIGGGVSELTANPNKGYVFAYWQINEKSSKNANLKLCTDETIRVTNTRASEFTPIFVAESSVVNITTLEDATLKSDITNNRTAGKIYNLTKDCTLSSSFAPLGTFKGILKGNGHRVLGLNIDETTTGTATGIFTQLDGAVISELEIASGSIKSVRDNVGSIAGVMTNSLISRCASNISVSSTNTAGVVGGLVGSNSGTKSMIYCSRFAGSASGIYSSGIVGMDNNVVLYKNKYEGAISGLQSGGSGGVAFGYAVIDSGKYVNSAIKGYADTESYYNQKNTDVKSVTFGSLQNYSNLVAGVSNPIDISANNDGGVQVYRVAIGEGYNVYVLTTQSNTKIRLNNDSSYMFSQLSVCDSINFYKMVDSSYAFYINDMFGSCPNLTTLDLTDFDITSCTDMSGLFYNCGASTILGLSNWYTRNVVDMSWMFYGCAQSVVLDVCGWDTRNVTDMSGMFYGCTISGTLDLSGWDTSSVLATKYMFGSCKTLKTLDLSGWDTSGVTNTSQMFVQCSELTTIYVGSGWNVTNVSDSSSMFGSCTQLTGGNGTKYNSSYTDKTYARVDNTGAPGYLTLKN